MAATTLMRGTTHHYGTNMGNGGPSLQAFIWWDNKSIQDLVALSENYIHAGPHFIWTI